MQVKLPYHIRVLIPCYKEDLEIVQKTILAARTAILPENVARTIYLCDDGKDPEKRAWVGSLGADVVYVSGRFRKATEMNGKSGNLNNVARQLYPAVRALCWHPPDAHEAACRARIYVKALWDTLSRSGVWQCALRRWCSNETLNVRSTTC